MNTKLLQTWLDEATEHQRAFAEEQLILDVTEAIWAELDRQGITKAELAARLGKSKAYVTQLLNGSRNMTLRTLADIAFALGVEARFVLCDEEWSDNGWVDSSEATFGPRLMTRVPELHAANADWMDLETQKA